MADTPNGLASMTQARERRARRVMPPPRHPVPAGNAEPTEPDPPQSDVAAIAVPVQSENQPPSNEIAAITRSDPKPKKLAGPRTQSKPVMVEAVGEESTPRPATLYLDGNLLDFLEEARIAGLVSRPKLDISKSAVVRLALRRLQEDMTIEEIRELLRSQPTDPTKTGRKRR